MKVLGMSYFCWQDFHSSCQFINVEQNIFLLVKDHTFEVIVSRAPWSVHEVTGYKNKFFNHKEQIFVCTSIVCFYYYPSGSIAPSLLRTLLGIVVSNYVKCFVRTHMQRPRLHHNTKSLVRVDQPIKSSEIIRCL